MTPTEGEDGAPDRDVVLVTIDCWRHDALQWMPALRDRIEDGGYEAAEAVCAAPATRGAFAAIFAGQHYPHVYAGFNEVRDEVEPLAGVLSDAGYATGGFVGSNPFLSAWRGEFDRFWNDRLDAAPGSGPRERLRGGVSRLRRATNYLRVRGRAPVGTVAARAREWYRKASGPRFLWMHLMEPHAPYLPGARRALGVGPLSVYRAHWRYNRDPDALSDRDRETLRECYRASVAYLDDRIDRVLDFVDEDAAVVVMGDHGEEFDHGAFGHARLYDETVRVPLLARGLPAIAEGDLVRQIDVGATTLSALDLPVPGDWRGRPHDGAARDAFMLNHSPRFGRTYAGIRTERRKLLRTADADTGDLLGRELYDLTADPEERTDRSDELECPDLTERLGSFLDGDGVREGLLERDREDTPAVVEDRLEALGYR